MPGMDGEELLRRLTKEEMLRSIPVVVVSTDATLKRIGRMMDLGARGYLTKPFLPESLRAELERTLGVPCA
jgi:two-component system chemotaxis response regulator CheY